jgi:hypothetical protein
VKCTVSRGEDDLYHFEFVIDGRTKRGRTRTKLIGMAVVRARIRIDREVRKNIKPDGEPCSV